jgi:hypothetical protein
MHGAGQMLGSLQSAFDEGLLNNHLGRHVRQFTSAKLPHGLEVSRHPINTHRDAVDGRCVLCRGWQTIDLRLTEGQGRVCGSVHPVPTLATGAQRPSEILDRSASD